MKRFLIATTVLTLLAAPVGGAFAQGWDNNRHDDRRGGNAMMHNDGMRHDDNGRHNWRQGERINRGDWGRYERVDYRRNHLRQPPRGYEWRRVDNNYVLAAAATGLIASVILANR